MSLTTKNLADGFYGSGNDLSFAYESASGTRN